MQRLYINGLLYSWAVRLQVVAQVSSRVVGRRSTIFTVVQVSSSLTQIVVRRINSRLLIAYLVYYFVVQPQQFRLFVAFVLTRNVKGSRKVALVVAAFCLDAILLDDAGTRALVTADSVSVH